MVKKWILFNSRFRKSKRHNTRIYITFKKGKDKAKYKINRLKQGNMVKQMKTYRDNNRIYFYDFIIRSWTVYECDENGNQLNNDKGADHYGRKEHMISDNPEFKFTIYND